MLKTNHRYGIVLEKQTNKQTNTNLQEAISISNHENLSQLDFETNHHN